MPPISADGAEWRETQHLRCIGLDSCAADGGPFRGTLELLLNCDGVRLFRVSHSAGAAIQQTCVLENGDDGIVLFIPLKTGLSVEACSGNLRANAGEALIVRNGDFRQAVSTTDNAIYILTLNPASSKAFAQREDAPAGTVHRRNKSLRLLASYMAWLHRNAGSITPGMRHVFGQHLVQLTLLCSTAHKYATARADGSSVARMQSAKDYILHNFHNGNLSELDLALHQGISVRYLQKLFEREGTTFTACLTEYRLHAAQALLRAANAERTILDIAFVVGYNDPSHFHRMFKRKFGCTPQGARRRWAEESNASDCAANGDVAG